MARKKTHSRYGKGSVCKDESRNRDPWVVEIRVNRKTVKQRYATEQEAEDALIELRKLRRDGVNLTQRDIKLSHWLEYWLENIIQPNYKKSTFTQYCSTVKLYITPYLGHLKLSQLTIPVVRQWLNTLRKDISDATARNTYMRLRRALEDAVRDGVITNNPTRNITAPKVRRKEINPWTEAEAQQFLTFIAHHRQVRLYQMALITGMRQGELISLRWSDIEWADNEQTSRVIRVRHNTQHHADGHVSIDGTPKTAAGERRIWIGQDIQDILQTQWDSLQREREILGRTWKEHGLVFPSQVGTPLSRQSILLQFKTLVQRAGLPDITFHQLRHTAASHMIANGVSYKIVSDILGHSSIKITLDLYGHSYDEHKASALTQQARRLGIKL